MDLAGHEPEVGATAGHELHVSAALDDAPALEHQDPVGADHAGEPVGKDQGRAAGHEPLERCLDDGLAFRVHRREGLVEDQDGRVTQEGARDGDALALAARQPDPTLTDDGVVPQGQPRDELVGVGLPRRSLELGLSRLRFAHPEVLGHGPVKQVRVLMDDGQEPAKIGDREVPDVATADEHASFVGIVEAQQEPGHGRLARPARSDDRHPLPRPQGEGQPLVRGTTAARVPEGHILEGDRRREAAHVSHRARRIPHGGPDRQESQHASGSRDAQHALVQEHAEIAQRAEHLDAQHEHDQQRLEAHRSREHPLHAPCEGHGRPERDAHVGDAAGQGVRPEDAHGRPEQLAAPLGQERGASGALAERLQRGQPLEGIEELGPERAVGALARDAPDAVPPVPETGREQRHERRPQQDERDREIQPRHEAEDEHRRQSRHEELGQVLAEVHLELLDALDQGQDHLARPGGGEVGRAQGEDVRVQPLAQARLHAGGRPVGGHGPGVVEGATERDRDGHRDRRTDQGDERRTGQDAAEQPAQEGQAGDPGGDRQETEQYRPRDPDPDSRREGPELRI